MKSFLESTDRTKGLLLLGHGSHFNADSSLPVRQMAVLLRQSNFFHEVQTGFWKEEPNLSSVLDLMTSEEVFIVPYFISDGYFTRQILPRELNLSGKVTSRGNQKFYYTEPVGTHPRMAEIIQDSLPAHPRGHDTTLIIVGHGTTQDKYSKESIFQLARTLNRKGVYHEVLPAFMEEEPFDHHILDLVQTSQVIILPYFISDGFHTREEIPQRMGLLTKPGESLKTPTLVHKRGGTLSCRYLPSAGTSPALLEIVLERIKETIDASLTPLPHTHPRPLEILTHQIPLHFGEIFVSTEAGTYTLCHKDDILRLDSELNLLKFSNETIEQLVRLNAEESYRPNRSASNLVSGWRLKELSANQLKETLEIIYPGTCRQWDLWKQNRLPLRSWKETSSRQNGIYSGLKHQPESVIREIRKTTCLQGCVKTPFWKIEKEDRVPEFSFPQNPPMLPCPEPCNWFLEQVRKTITP